MEPRDLELFVDAALRRLPEPRAPRSLLPRVMAVVATTTATGAIEGTRQPWYAGPWVTWPRAWQSASIVVLVAALGGSVFGVIGVDRGLARLTDRAPIVGAISTVTRLVWDTLLQPAAVYSLVAFLAVLFASALTWRMCSRVALEGAPQP